MDIEQLGYYLYMESCESENKTKADQDENTNVEINPFLVTEKPTTNED